MHVYNTKTLPIFVVTCESEYAMMVGHMIVSREAKKKQAVCDERVSYLQVALL